jgi:integrase/recombinase XerD
MSEFNAFEAAAERQYDETRADELSNEELRDIFFEWAEQNKKPNTADFYQRNFAPFYEQAQAADKHLTADVTRNIVKGFLEHEAKTLSPKTVSHRYSTISRFYSVLRGERGLLDADESTPMEHLSQGDVSGLSQKTMTETTDGEEFHYLKREDVTKLIENAPVPEQRNRALLRLMANTGMRASEVRNVKVENIDLGAKQLVVKSPKLSEPNDPEIITVSWRSEQLTDELSAFIEFRRDSYPYAAESPYLFVSQQSPQISYDSIRRIVDDAATDADLQGVIGTDARGNDRQTVTPHVLRHSYAMACLNNGMNVNEVKEALHHQKVETTMMYLREHKEETRKAIQSKGPTF